MGQTREMKALLTLSLLLLCTVLTVTGREKGAPNHDPCTHGMTVIEIFVEERSCSPDYRDFLGNMTRSWRGMPSVEEIRNLFTVYCSTAFPAMKQCFMGNMQNCSADQRDYLSGLASETGFVCQPNSNQVHPNLLYVLSQMTEPNLVVLEQCSDDFGWEAFESCLNEAAKAIGLSSSRELRRTLERYTIQDLAPMVSTLMNSMFECLVKTVRDTRPQCPEWRWQVFKLLRYNVLPTILGRTNTFTQQQLAELFEFPQPEEEFGDEQGPFSLF